MFPALSSAGGCTWEELSDQCNLWISLGGNRSLFQHLTVITELLGEDKRKREREKCRSLCKIMATLGQKLSVCVW